LNVGTAEGSLESSPAVPRHLTVHSTTLTLSRHHPAVPQHRPHHPKLTFSTRFRRSMAITITSMTRNSSPHRTSTTHPEADHPAWNGVCRRGTLSFGTTSQRVATSWANHAPGEECLDHTNPSDSCRANASFTISYACNDRWVFMSRHSCNFLVFMNKTEDETRLSSAPVYVKLSPLHSCCLPSAVISTFSYI
jgi:hypothetical protein